MVLYKLYTYHQDENFLFLRFCVNAKIEQNIFELADCACSTKLKILELKSSIVKSALFIAQIVSRSPTMVFLVKSLILSKRFSPQFLNSEFQILYFQRRNNEG